MQRRLHAGKVLRGPRQTDRDRRPDAELWINGSRHLLEFDRGTMGYPQIERRFRIYEGCKDLVLWVCSSRQRAEGFRRRAERIRAIALFTTFAEVLASPHGPVWRDYTGGVAALPREGAR